MRSFYNTTATLLLAFFIIGCATEPDEGLTISGRIRFLSLYGAELTGIEDAEVHLNGSPRSYETKADAQGNWRFTNLPMDFFGMWASQPLTQ
jgi:hypothetical protein